MAIIKRGILGGFSKKIGSVVGSSWKGIAVMRSLPLSVANPKTAGQVKQRTKFRVISEFASQILTTWIKPLWDRSAQRMSGYNAFIQANIENGVVDGQIAPSNLEYSHGRLGRTEFVAVAQNAGAEVKFDWDPTPTGAFQMSDDLVYALLVDQANGLIGVSSAEATRDDGSLIVEVTGTPSVHGVVAVLAFLREDGSISSDAVKESVTPD